MCTDLFSLNFRSMLLEVNRDWIIGMSTRGTTFLVEGFVTLIATRLLWEWPDSDLDTEVKSLEELDDFDCGFETYFDSLYDPGLEIDFDSVFVFDCGAEPGLDSDSGKEGASSLGAVYSLAKEFFVDLAESLALFCLIDLIRHRALTKSDFLPLYMLFGRSSSPLL